MGRPAAPGFPVVQKLFVFWYNLILSPIHSTRRTFDSTYIHFCRRYSFTLLISLFFQVLLHTSDKL
ncbi:hypothetical protein BDR26DRAFT_854403, partial [Obelidium mucronatum]